MTFSHYDILIVGGGHAGAQAAVALRQKKFAGSIAIISDERELPTSGRPFPRSICQASRALSGC